MFISTHEIVFLFTGISTCIDSICFMFMCLCGQFCTDYVFTVITD